MAVTAAASAQMLVMNEVYPGGGSASATAAYHEDFIELLNTGTVSIDVTGFTLAYGASTQTAGNFPTIIGTLGASALSGSSIVAPGQTLLINTGTISTGGAANPAADFQFTSGAGLSASNGGVRLENAAGTVLDIVGYGTSQNFEGTAAATPTSIAYSLNRTNGVDTNNNAADFTSQIPSPTASVVPEPATYAYLLGGLGTLALVTLRRRCTA